VSYPALLLRGARVVDPAEGLDGPADVLVRDGRIERVGPSLPETQGD
jgi:dihydroorotase